MPNFLLPDMETYEQWSAEMGVPFDRVLKQAGVSKPDDARASRARMRKGGAPRVREALHEVLSDLERKRETPTPTGSLLLGIAEWQALGAELAGLEPERFRSMLEALRERVRIARVANESEAAFMAIKPPEKPRR